MKKVVLIIGVAAILVGGVGSLFASGNPDGLEWSLFGNAEEGYSANMGLDEEAYGVTGEAALVNEKAAAIQDKTALLPDYAFAADPDNMVGTSFSGILGSAIVGCIAAAICFAGNMIRKKKS